MLTVGLVVMVIFLFLRNLSATIIPSVAVPLSLVGTFGVMYMLGYSLNNLTLMALTISTGFVVDDAIVMIENIARYIEEGEPPLRAALRGAEQIGFTIISLTISLIAVLIPLLFMGDIVGRLFREFAVTLAVTILVSAVVSLTLTPMMCSKLLKHTPRVRAGTPLPRLGTRLRGGDRALRQDAAVRAALADRHPAGGRRHAASSPATSSTPSPRASSPSRIPASFRAFPKPAQTVSFPEMSTLQQQLTKVILTDPAVDNLSSFIGIDGTNTTLNSGRILINLKPLDERKISATRRHPPPAAAAGESRRHHPVHAAGAGPDGGRPRQPHAVPIHPGRPQRRRVEHLRAENAGPLQELPRTHAMWPPTSRCRACAPGWSSTATPPRAWESRPPPSTRPSTTPTASGKSPPSSRSSTSITWCSK